MRTHRRTASLLLALVAALGVARTGSAAPSGCAAAAAGGEWRSYSHDLANSRHQPDEHTIDAARAASLKPAWIFNAASVGGGSFDNTPAIADGCVYLNGGTTVYALNADTGALVWRAPVGSTGGSPAVADGKVFANTTNPPGTIAIDQETGLVMWEAPWGDRYPGAGADSSPAVFNGMVLATLATGGAELFDPDRNIVRGQYALLDADDGTVLYKGYTIPDEQFMKGYSGGGLWATPAVDVESGYAYEGTGNPYLKEHPYTNAIIKIDIDPTRETFGKIVGHLHGEVDTYPLPGDGAKPTCDLSATVATCEFNDLDFGSSPQLFTDPAGRKLVGDLQKSGVYHAADADTMQEVWKTTVGLPASVAQIFMGSSATSSFDGEKLYVAGAYPGQVHALARDTGADVWNQPMADVNHYQPISTANGLTYTVDGSGILHAFDSDSGVDVLARPLASDLGAPVVNAIGADGVAIARNTVFVPVGSYVIAYR